MRLHLSGTTPAPSDPARLRLRAEVTYAAGSPNRETLWFEVPADLEDALVTTGDPWLVLLVPLAMTLGEDLELEAPVDPALVHGVRRATAVWKGWFPGLRVPGIRVRGRERLDGAPAGSAGSPGSPAGGGGSRWTASLFSGGVDSFFTVLRHEEAFHTEEDGPREEISDLLTLGGADIPVTDGRALEGLVDRLRPAAEALGKRLVLVTTNARETRWRTADWTRMSHGPLLAAAGLVLGGRYDRILIPASLPYVRSQLPWGSHPFVDPLFSTSGTRVGDDGAGSVRTEKTARVAASELALRTLRVCWADGGVENCGRCAKCQRTMATLEVAGALDDCTAFPPGSFSVEGLAGLRVEEPAETRMLDRTVGYARERGRSDVARALETAVRGSYRRQAVVRLARRLDELGLPTRLARGLEGRARRGMVR